MPYTIKVNSEDVAAYMLGVAHHVRAAFIAALERDGRFKADVGQTKEFYRGSREGSRKFGIGFELKKIRLTKAKPYCGQHPGECIVNPFRGPEKKKSMTLLEWDDWVAFNNLVNLVLDALRIDADVWSKPLETKGIMWIRKGLRARVQYDWEDDYRNGNPVPIRVWNNGTDDQFREAKLPRKSKRARDLVAQ